MSKVAKFLILLPLTLISGGINAGATAIARDDLFFVRENPPGPWLDVISNDENVGTEAAQLVSPPEHATTFSLKADGTFVYEFTKGVNQDSFSYRLGSTGNVAHVRLVRTPFHIFFPEMAVGRVRPRGAIVGDNWFVFGGTADLADKQLLSSAEKLDIPGFTWTSIADLPPSAGKVGFGVDSIGSTIYVVGGRNSSGISGETWAYDTVGDTWSQTDSLPANARIRDAIAIAVGSKLYLSGGTTDAGAPNTQTFIFDPAAAPGSRWTSVAGPSADLSYPAAVAINGRIYLEASSSSRDTCSAWTFNPATNLWSQIASPNEVGPESQLYNVYGTLIRIGTGFYVQSPPDVYGLNHGEDEFFLNGKWNRMTFGNFVNNAPNLFWAYDSSPKWLVKCGGANEYGQAVGRMEITWLTNSYPAPVAKDDSFTTFKGKTLSVASPGLLANDVDYREGGMLSVLHAQGANGTATVNTTGGFHYLSQVVGVHSFTYRAIDSGQQSAPATVQMTVQPNAATLTAPATVVGGTSFTATLDLAEAALEPGVTASLFDNSSAISTPSAVTVASGNTSANFNVSTSAVSAVATRQISAKTGNVTVAAAVRLIPAPKLQAISLSSASVVGGEDVEVTLTLRSEAAPGGSTVSVSDNSGAITTPSSVSVGAGETTAKFNASTSQVTASYTRVITASLGGVSRSAFLTLHPLLSSITLDRTSIKGGQSVEGTVTLLRPAGAGGELVTLSDSSDSIATPASVLVPAGATSATFTVNTSAVSGSFTRQVFAQCRGARKIALLTLTP